ncbi:hypothetical protein WA577_005855 [Blastocystis sp. JDR]
MSPLSVAESEGCLAVPAAAPDAEGGASCGGGQDGEITMAFDCFNACSFIREENGKEQSVWRSTENADGPKQEHDADPSDGLSAKASVVSRAIPDGDLAAIWRQKRWLEKVDGLVRREDCWATPRTSCAEVRCGESSSATPYAFPRLSHWEVFAVPLGVVDSSRSKGC